VAVYVASGLRRVTGFLAILKAGGVYLPVDPSLPMERVAHLLDDSQAPVVVVESRTAGALPTTWSRVVHLDEEADAIAEAPRSEADGALDPADLAYLIYTSGSTGQPKPVAVSHEALCNMALDQIEVFGIRPGMRVLPFASCGFDASVSELCMALLGGGTLVLAADDRLEAASSILDILEANAIGAVTLPPAL